jgi:hypothetical protein
MAPSADAVDGLMLHITVAPVAENCTVAPAAGLAVAGLTAMDGGASVIDTE